MLIHGDLSQVGKHAVLANPSSKGPREFIVLSEMQAGAEYGDFSTADGEKITSMISFFSWEIQCLDMLQQHNELPQSCHRQRATNLITSTGAQGPPFDLVNSTVRQGFPPIVGWVPFRLHGLWWFSFSDHCVPIVVDSHFSV